MPSPTSNNVAFRLESLEESRRNHADRIDNVERVSDRHQVELHGDRGVNETLRALAEEIKWLRRALWGLAASVTVAAIVFALGSLGGPMS